MRKFLLAILVLSYSALLNAQILVVANIHNPVNSLTRKQAVDLFMGRVSSFPNGQRAFTLDYNAGTPLRAEFYKSLTGKSEAQVDAYWATLVFAGRMTPPQQLNTPSALLNALSLNPAAVGYIAQQPLPDNIKIIMELPSSP